MNIKQEKKKFKLDIGNPMGFIFGGGDNKGLPLFVLGSTLGIWFSAFIIGSIIFLMDGTSMVYLETVIQSLMIGSMIGFGVTILVVLANNDFNRNYGWGMWFRSIIYNMVFFTIFYLIHSGATVEEHREAVISFELVTSDIDDCEYMVKMESKYLVYNHCSDRDSTYNKVAKSKDLDAYLIGKIRYGTNIADHFEFVEKKIMVKAK